MNNSLNFFSLFFLDVGFFFIFTASAHMPIHSIRHNVFLSVYVWKSRFSVSFSGQRAYRLYWHTSRSFCRFAVWSFEIWIFQGFWVLVNQPTVPPWFSQFLIFSDKVGRAVRHILNFLTKCEQTCIIGQVSIVFFLLQLILNLISILFGIILSFNYITYAKSIRLISSFK